MINHGLSHSLAVLVSVLMASFLYEKVVLQFLDAGDRLTYWMKPALEIVNLNMPEHTIGLIATATAIGFVVGVFFYCLRKS